MQDNKYNKSIIKGKTKRRVKSNGSGWAGNALKSLGYSARDIISEMMPNSAQLVSEATDTKKELDDLLTIASKKTKEAAASGKSMLNEFKDKDLKEFIDDLKSGKIYNRDREQDFGDFDFDDGFSFDEDFDDVEVSSDNPSTNVIVNSNISEDNPMVEAQYNTSAMVMKGTELIAKESRSNSVTVATSISKMSVGVTRNLQLIHSEVAKLSSTLPASMTEHAALSAKYYEESIGYQKRTADALDELKELYKTSTRVVGSTTTDKKDSKLSKLSYGINSIFDYKELVKGQLKEEVDNNFIVSALKMYADVVKTEKDTGGGKSLGAKALNALLKTSVSKGMKKGAGTLDQFLSGMIMPMGMKMGDWQDDWQNPIKQMLGKVFGIKGKPSLYADKSNYDKGVVSFDGKVHRAITDVIPTYLRMIASAVTGKEEVAFDYEKGVYNTVSNIKKNFDSDVKKAGTSDFYSEKGEFASIVKSLTDITKDQADQLTNSFEDFLYKMVKSGDFTSFRKKNGKDDIARLLGPGADAGTVDLIRNYFEGLYDQGRHADLNSIFTTKTMSARANLEKTYNKMTSDGTTHNYNLIDNGLNGSNGTEVATRESFAADKYKRTSASYLRDILTVLSTGIKVVNVGSATGNVDDVLNISNKMLGKLGTDRAVFRASQQSLSDNSGTKALKISYDLEKSIDVINKVLTIDETDSNLLDKLSSIEKINKNSILGKSITILKTSRDKINNKVDNIVRKTTSAGIDAIYGKKEQVKKAGDDPDVFLLDEPPSPSDPKVTNVLINDFRNKLKGFSTAFTESVINPMTKSLYDDDDGLITQIEDTSLNGDDATTPKKVTDNIKETAKTGVKNVALGLKDEEGNYQSGLMSDMANSAALAKVKFSSWTKELLYGTDDGKETGIMGNMRKFFGEKEDGKLDISGKIKEVGGEFKEHFKNRAYEWSDMLFGKSDESDESKLDIFLGDIKGKKGLIGAAGVVGALSSFFLPGGPIGGALLGAGLGIASQSIQLKDFLFGKTDEDGNRSGGFITKEFQDFFKNNGKGIKIGIGTGVAASIGLIPSFFVPGGPIGGALLGAGLSVASKSEAFTNLLYGEGGTKDDPTGGITKYIKDHYNKDKDMKSTFMDAGIGAGVGILGSFFLPGGPIIGGLIGAGANIALNTDRFKNYFFGEEDPEDGKRKGGVFGKYRDLIVEKAEEAQDKLSLWISENVTNPLAASVEPLKERAKRFLFGNKDEDGDNGLVGAIADRVNNSAFGDLKKAIKENIIDKMKDAFKKIFGAFGNMVKSIITSPIKAIQQVSEDADVQNGGTGASVSQRLSELNEKSRQKHKERVEARKNKRNTQNINKPDTTQSSADLTTPTVKEIEKKISDETTEIAVVSTSTQSIENVVQEQLTATKENQTETKSLLNNIINLMPGGKKKSIGITDSSTGDEGAKAITGKSLLGKSDPVDRIDKNVSKIADSVNGQLNGAGYNLNRIYKLLRKRLKKGMGVGDDDEDDDYGEGLKNNKYKSILSRLNPVNLIKSTTKFLTKSIVGIKDAIVGQIKGLFKGILNVGKTIIGIPKMLIKGVASALPNLLKGFGSILETGAHVITSGFKALGTILENSAAGFGNLISAALTGFGSLMQGFGVIGKEALSLLAKGGSVAIRGVAKAGSFLAKKAVSGVSSLFKRRKGKAGASSAMMSNITISGGHLDYVTLIKKIGDGGGDGSSSPITNAVSKVVPLASGTVSDESSQAAVGSHMGLKDKLKSKVKSAKTKGSNILSRVKGAASSIRDKFKKEDAEEEQRSWRDKLLSAVRINNEGNEKHHSVWSSIFSKKGLITAGLVLLAPLVIKAVKGLISVFGSGIFTSLANGIADLAAATTNGVDESGGLSGVINNVGEQTKAVTDLAGLTGRSEYVIDEATGTIVTDENGNMVKKSVGPESFGKRVKEFFVPTQTRINHETGEAYQSSEWGASTETRLNLVGTGTHLGAHKIKKNLINPAKGFLKSEAGQTTIKTAKNYGGKFASGAKKLGGKLTQSNKVQTILKYCKGAVDFVITKAGDLLKKFKCGESAGKITKKITEITAKVLDAGVIGKFIGKFVKPLAKVAAAAGTLLASDVAWGVIGAISGACNAGELFQVNPEDVDVKMVAISAMFKGILNTSWAGWVDVINDIAFEVIGVDFISELAVMLYKIVSPEEDDAKIDQLRADFDQEYKDYVTEEYDAYVKNMEQSGKGDEVMSFDEYKGSDIATSKADYVAEKNPSLGKRVFDGVKSLGKGIVDTAKNAGAAIKNRFTKHEDTGWFDANGCYYVKNGDIYDYYNPNGDMISIKSAEAVDQMIESGQLTKGAVEVEAGLIQDVKQTITGIKKGWGVATTAVKTTVSGWVDKLKEHHNKQKELAGKAVKRLFSRKETVYTSPNGCYYKKGEGDTYDYYNANGALISSGITEEEILGQLESGQLVESEEWVLNEKFEEIGKLASKSFKELQGLSGEVISEFKNVVSSGAEYWKNNIKEHGIFGAVKNAFTKKKGVAWYDAKGGYYIERADGNFDYYSMNGDLVSESIDKEEVQGMILEGLLVEGEYEKDSDAKAAITGIKDKLKSFWDSAKEWGSNSLDSAKDWLKKNTSKDNVFEGKGSSTNVAGKGGDEDEDATVSSSGTVNGFSYYSQNDPSIKNKQYKLSDGGTDTFGDRGCGPASMAMVASQLTGKQVDPVGLANLATDGGYSVDGGTTPEYFQDTASKLGLSATNTIPTKESVEMMLRSGKPVILQGQDSREGSPFTSEGHYVVGVGMNGNNIIVNDPRGREYSREYGMDSILSGAQNVWGFSNGGESTEGPMNSDFAGASDTSTADMKNGFPFLLQGDSRWGNVVYTSTGDNSQTIKTSGCGPTSMAMVLRSFGANVSPVDTAKYSLDNGYRTANSGTSHGFFGSIGSKYGLETKNLEKDVSSAVAELNSGKPVIASMGPSTFTKGGHFITLSGISKDGQILVNDPASDKRSNLAYSPDIFRKEGKKFWSFSKNGSGSINNIGELGPISIDNGVISDMGTSTSGSDYIIEGSPDGTISNPNEVADGTTGEASDKPKSILEFLMGAASALTKPITDWLTGKKSGESSESSEVMYDESTSALTNGLNLGTVSVGSDVAGTSKTGASAIGSYSRAGDFLGKYTAQFESGNRGPLAISGGIGDKGGVSFGTYQFATGGAEHVSTSSQLYRFWDMYYASKHPNVKPGSNQAFKDAWIQEASANPAEFSERERSFMVANYYAPQKAKLANIVDPDEYDRGLQELVYASAIQFGPNTKVIANALDGKNVKGMQPDETINAIQDYKVQNNSSLFSSCSDNVRAGVKNRHDVTERQQMLQLAGKPPIKPMKTAVGSHSNFRMNEAAKGGKGGKGSSSGKQITDNSFVLSDNPTASMVDRDKFNSTSRIEQKNPIYDAAFMKMVELLGYIVENTRGIDKGVRDLFSKEVNSTTQIVGGQTHNNLIPIPQNSENNPKSTQQYNTAKRISAGIYLD